MYHYRASGLDYIYLVNGYEEVETDYGPTVSIHDIEGLHKVIGSAVIEQTSPLSGNEFRFLRTELGFSQKNLGKIFRITEQTVANWEKSHSELPQTADYCLRMLYQEKILNEDAIIGHMVDLINDYDRQESHKVMLESMDGWKKKAA